MREPNLIIAEFLPSGNNLAGPQGTDNAPRNFSRNLPDNHSAVRGLFFSRAIHIFSFSTRFQAAWRSGICRDDSGVRSP